MEAKKQLVEKDVIIRALVLAKESEINKYKSELDKLKTEYSALTSTLHPFQTQLSQLLQLMSSNQFTARDQQQTASAEGQRTWTGDGQSTVTLQQQQ